MKKAGLIFAAFVFIGYCCFAASQILFSEPGKTESVDSLTATAQDALDNENYPVAIEQFTRALERNPNDAALHGSLGIALARAGRTDAAISEFEICMALDPQRWDIAKQLGMSLYQSEKLKEAKGRLESVTSNRPDDAEAFQWLFTINDRLELPLENLPVLERLTELRPDNPEYVYAQVTIYEQSGQVDKALQTFEALPAAEQETTKARFVLGALQFKRRDYAKAIELLEQVVVYDPDHAEAKKLLQLAQTQAEQAREFDQEIVEIQKLVEASPEDSDLLFKLGLVLTKAGRPDDATVAFEKCLTRLDPEEVTTVKERATQLYSLERFDLAEQCLNLVRDAKKDVGIYELLLAVNSHRNQPLERLPILKKLATLKPDDPNYVTWQLGIYLENGKPKEAMELMKNMPLEWHDQVQNQFIMGVTYYQLKEFSKAIQVLEKVVKNQPENADAKKILEFCRSELK